MPAENETIGGRDAVMGTRFIDAQDQRIIETARPLENSATTGASTQNRNSILLAKGHVNLLAGLAGISEDYKIAWRFPNSKQFARFAFLAEVEQGFVAGEVLFRRGQGQIAVVHVWMKECGIYSASTGPFFLTFVNK